MNTTSAVTKLKYKADGTAESIVSSETVNLFSGTIKQFLSPLTGDIVHGPAAMLGTVAQLYTAMTASRMVVTGEGFKLNPLAKVEAI